MEGKRKNDKNKSSFLSLDLISLAHFLLHHPKLPTVKK